MRIISKQKDYYDSVQGVMYDSDITYHRKEYEVEECINFVCDLDKLMFIGFCGKIYPVFVYQQESNSYMEYCFDDINSSIRKSHNLINKSFYMYGEKYKKTICIYDLEIAYKIYECNYKIKYRYGNADKINKFKDKINNAIVEIEKLNLFEKHNTPYFLLTNSNQNCISNYEITVAPLLSDYRFQEVFDPYSAYQELVMWIGNQAVSEYPPQIKDDKIIRDSKGFDNWSFKNKWSEKKQRRGNKK